MFLGIRRHPLDQCGADPSPPEFRAVGLWYEHFPQLTDEEVRALLNSTGEEVGGGME